MLGARQVGKTTLMEDIVLETRGHFTEIRRFNLEYPEDLLFFSQTEGDILQQLTEKPNTLLVIDEFHYVKNISKIFKAIYDKQKNIQILASGSSSLDIHKHLKESLVGRQNVVTIYPLSLDEWKQTGHSLEDFIIYGGMPGLLHLKKDKDQMVHDLDQIVQSYIMKDIRSLIKEENISAFNHLLFYLAENQGQILPTANIAREIRLNVKIIEKYLSLLEQTYVIYSLYGFSGKLSNELKKARKFYFYDNGVRNLLVKDFSPLQSRNDFGLLYESHLFLELKKHLKPNISLRFWRTKHGDEVDFIWIKDRQPIPIECKSSYSGRPPKGLIKFMAAYKIPYGVVVNKDVTKTTTDDVKIIYIKFEDFHPDKILPEIKP